MKKRTNIFGTQKKDFQFNNTKVVPMNVIAIVLQTSGATYRNSFKAHVFCSS